MTETDQFFSSTLPILFSCVTFIYVLITSCTFKMFRKDSLFLAFVYCLGKKNVPFISLLMLKLLPQI